MLRWPAQAPAPRARHLARGAPGSATWRPPAGTRPAVRWKAHLTGRPAAGTILPLRARRLVSKERWPWESGRPGGLLFGAGLDAPAGGGQQVAGDGRRQGSSRQRRQPNNLVGEGCVILATGEEQYLLLGG